MLRAKKFAYHCFSYSFFLFIPNKYVQVQLHNKCRHTFFIFHYSLYVRAQSLLRAQLYLLVECAVVCKYLFFHSLRFQHIKRNIMAAKPILYYAPRSPPSRSVLLIAKALNVDLHLQLTLNDKGENRTPEFLKVQ